MAEDCGDHVRTQRLVGLTSEADLLTMAEQMLRFGVEFSSVAAWLERKGRASQAATGTPREDAEVTSS